MIIDMIRAPITYEWYAANEALVAEHPVLQQMVAKMAEIERGEARQKAENAILQHGLARIAALALAVRGFATPVDLKQAITKIDAIAGEIKNGLDDVARLSG